MMQIVPLSAPGQHGLPLDKIYHFLTISLLVLMFYVAHYSLAKSIIFSALIGGVGELIQIPLSYRSASWADWGTELLGIFLMAVAIGRLVARSQKLIG
ncbi:MAG TPA: hypothetical protein ENL06_00715 [Candidatus Portnoybacteria bacterium]|nr:hypothetical protein [Candidatus Portnoybacteria bacterium]